MTAGGAPAAHEDSARSATSEPPPASTCRTMADVRLGVDALDRQLVALLALRQGYMDAAARIKADRGKVHDAERIEDVVTKVRAAAEAAGLSVTIAEPVWRLLIDRCIAYELEAWDRLHPTV